MPMRLRVSTPCSWFRVSAVTIALGVIGCGDDGLVPPPPPELKAAGAVNTTVLSTKSGAVSSDLVGSAAAGVKSLELILSGGRDPYEIETEKSSARMQAGMDKARLRITVVGEERSDGPEPASIKNQVTLVREAVARHPQALIVEPEDPGNLELAKAIHEARTAKVPVVLLDRPLTGGAASPDSSVSAPMVLVAPEPFLKSAAQLVAAAIRNTKNAKLDPQGGAIILVNKGGDPFVADRVTAIRDALKAAGIKAILEIEYTGESSVGQKLLTDRLKKDPKPTMVFSTDFPSSSVTNDTVSEIAGERPFIQVGYTSDDNQLRLARVGEFAALGQYVPSRLIRKAVSTAVSIALKQQVANPVLIPVIVTESPENSGVAQFQARHKASMKAKAGSPE